MKKPKPKKARPPVSKKKLASKPSLAVMEDAMRIFGPALSRLAKK